MTEQKTETGAGSPSLSTPLLACPHCGSETIMILKDNLCHIVCAEGSACRGSGLITCCFPEDAQTAADAWNRRHANAEAHGRGTPRPVQPLVGRDVYR
jgi:hypothetical protein